ncbi:hypothetical protein ACOSQ3_013373 [Xanthoceras sorbifolium]
MATRNQSNADFCNEVHEILGHHESSIDEVHTTLQTVLTELQSLKASQNHSHNQPETNPFAPTESSQHVHLASTSHSQPNTDRNQHHLKLKFPKFSGDDLQGWIYKAKQFFEFKEWHRWYAKFKGPVTWTEFTKPLLLRFGPTNYEDPSDTITRLKQTSTVSVYKEEFEKFSH